MKPGIPKGTRDFSPIQIARRNYIFNTIRKVFEKYGYSPIETPSMENMATLTGKYGEEGDRLLFKILNSGEFLAKADRDALDAKDSIGLIPSIAEKGLRYDLTVPFARYVVMHQHEINFPFKRYQIQPVWRADRPQRGRYREFYQCDVDVVGSDSLMYEAELVKIYDEVFSKLGLSTKIKVNNRKILFGIAEAIGKQENFVDLTVAIDKLDKIGKEGVTQELVARGFSSTDINFVQKAIEIETLDSLKVLFADSPAGMKGISEMEEFYAYVNLMHFDNELVLDVSLARGLNYYTGCIFEVEVNDVNMGSVGGGGRYDDLTSVFGLKDVSGVGISFGAERIFDCLEELSLFPEGLEQKLKLLLIAMDNESHKFAFKILSILRKNNIASDLYPSPVKLKKQMKYANDRNVPYVVILGSDEISSGQLTLKDMMSGEQHTADLDEIIERLSDR